MTAQSRGVAKLLRKVLCLVASESDSMIPTRDAEKD